MTLHIHSWIVARFLGITHKPERGKDYMPVKVEGYSDNWLWWRKV